MKSTTKGAAPAAEEQSEAEPEEELGVVNVHYLVGGPAVVTRPGTVRARRGDRLDVTVKDLLPGKDWETDNLPPAPPQGASVNLPGHMFPCWSPAVSRVAKTA